jgi:hypothetical protein
MANSNKRKPLSKKIRFEVLKKFKFTCVYCGGSAPDVLIEVDHIVPVAEGGTNDLMNLTAACKKCNIGKGKNRLDDKTLIDKSKIQMEEVQERKDQLGMMLKWQKELEEFNIEIFDGLVSKWDTLMNKELEGNPHHLTDSGKQKIRKAFDDFDYVLVVQAIDIAAKTYFKYDESGAPTNDSISKALEKLGGICYNKNNEKQESSESDPNIREIYRIKNIAKKKCRFHFREGEAQTLLHEAHKLGISFFEMENIAKGFYPNSWTQFEGDLVALIEQRKEKQPKDEDLDDYVKFVVSFSKEEANRIKDKAYDNNITPENLIWEEVTYAVQNTSDEQNVFWVSYLVNPNDKEDFIFHVDTIRPRTCRFGGKSKLAGGEYVNHFWGEYESKNDIAREMLTWSKEIYAFHPYTNKFEKFSGESDIDRLTSYLEKAYEDVFYLSRQPKIK